MPPACFEHHRQQGRGRHQVALRPMRRSEGGEVMDRPNRAPPILHAHQLNSMTNRIRRFLTENPHVELTFRQIRERFGIDKPRANDIIRNLTKEGIIESIRVVRVRPKGRVA